MPTTDFIEDAAYCLDHGESDYIIITLEDGATRFTSSIGPENRVILRQMVLDGDLTELFLDFLNRHYPDTEC